MPAVDLRGAHRLTRAHRHLDMLMPAGLDQVYREERSIGNFSFEQAFASVLDDVPYGAANNALKHSMNKRTDDSHHKQDMTVRVLREARCPCSPLRLKRVLHSILDADRELGRLIRSGS